MKNSKNINKCYAIDMSKGALEVAKINIENH
jgi:methylase of polypeptide subunit release factors